MSATQPATTTGKYVFWYDTTNNLMKVYSGTTNQWNTETLSLPFAMTYCDLPSGTTLDFSFTEMNGIHWFGNAIFVDKDVTFSAPNGRNEDGTLNNIEYTTDNVYYGTRTLSDNYPYYPIDVWFNTYNNTLSTYGSTGSGSAMYGAMASQTYLSTGTSWYNLNDNIIKCSNVNEAPIHDVKLAYIGTFLMDLNVGQLYPITGMGCAGLTNYNDVYRLPSYYGWYSMTYFNGTSGYRLYYYDAAFRYLAFGIQWGYFSGIAGTVQLYKPFSNASYHISLTYKASASQGSHCKTPTVLSTTTANFTIGYMDYASATVTQGVGWLAVGC